MTDDFGPIDRASFKHFQTIPTRLMDNDIYGHVNNVIYYSYFDTVVNSFLIDKGVLDMRHGAIIGLAVESKCTFRKELTYPEDVHAGMRLGKLGNSSARYELGLFRAGEDDPAATGYFIHVYVDRQNRRPVPMPAATRAVLTPLLRDAE